MSRVIIAFAGSKGSGKTTSFDIIKDTFENVHEVMLAGLLKKVCSEVFGFDETRLVDLAYKEEELEDPIMLTKDNLEKIVSQFTDTINFDTQIRPFMGKILDTRRQVLQYIGTDVLHEVDKLVHTKTAVANMPKDGIIVVTDLRFEEEFNYFKENHADEFFPFYIRNSAAEIAAEGDTHPSETQLHNFKNKCDLIDNNFSLADLRTKVINSVRKTL